jgi:uncharacterized membrane protein
MTEIHIVAGLLALLAGAVALAARKGSKLHRKSGLVFTGAMIVLTTSAVVLALFFTPNRVNVVAGLLTLYLVCTALLTVKREVGEMRGVTAALAVLAFVVGLRALMLGLEALGNPNHVVDQVPAPPLFMFMTVGITGALLDARLLWAGRIAGAHRLARHLWRMTFAMWIATMSFFLGQAKVFPELLRKTYLLMIPVLIVAIMLFYWLARVLIKKERAI